MKKHLNGSGSYNRIARETVTNPALSLKAKGLLTLVLGLPEDWDFSITGLLPFLQEGKEATLSALRELFEKGYADRTVCRARDGRFGKYEYTFFETPQTAIPTTGTPSSDSPQMDEPVREGAEQLRSNESNPNQIKKEKIKVLLACDSFMTVWEMLKATPKWLKKTPEELQTALESLAEYTPGEATALAEAALKNKWSMPVYESSSKKILENYHKKRPVVPITINPPRPKEPELSPEELERKNKRALASMSRRYFDEKKKEGRILSGFSLPIAGVFDFLLSSGAIKPNPERLEAIDKLSIEKDRYAAKRKLLEETFAEMISRSEELTIPSEEG